MGIKSFFSRVSRIWSGKPDEHHQAPEVAAKAEPKTEAGAKAEHPAAEGILTKIARAIKSRSMRRLEKGEGMLDVKGHYQSPHDMHCMEIMGCDLGVLAELHMGEIPGWAPNKPDSPHPLSDEYKAMKAKERTERYAKNKVAEVAVEAKPEIAVQEVAVVPGVEGQTSAIA